MAQQTLTQDNQYLRVSTPLGKDKLILQSMVGEERISELYRFHLAMISEDRQIDFAKLVGKTATVTLIHADKGDSFFQGYIARFVQAGSDERYTTYLAELVPWLWMLTLESDCRIYQNQSVPDIIKSVFDDLGFRDYRDSLKKTYTAREYCVQYRETAFDFVSRLMEEEGIFYYFEHTETKHTMILGDDADAHKPCPDVEEISFGAAPGSRQYEDTITGCTIEEQLVTGKYATDDYNFETPTTQLFAKADGNKGKRRVYDYPGRYDKKNRGEDIAKLRLEAFEVPVKLLRGESSCQGFDAGFHFTMADHVRKDANIKWVLWSVQHDAQLEQYLNTFEAFPASAPFRPAMVTPKPVIPGTQTAVVVGKAGEEMWTDKYGRIKVKFHWDQDSEKNEKSSCWIRVAQNWAGKTWGAFFLPRLDQEVVVTFLDGDPDRPLVTGAVYNAQQTVPYALPGNQTRSTVKSNTSKGGGGFNELRFEDKAGSEEVYIHAQKDMNTDVENDQTTTLIEGNRTTTVKKGFDLLKVETGKRTVEVADDESTTVKGKRSVEVTGNETHTDKANFDHKVSGNYTLKVSGNLTIKASGSVTIQSGGAMTVKAGQSMTQKAGMAFTQQSGTAMTVKAGTALTNKSGTSLTNKSGTSLTNQAGMSLTNKASMSLTNKANMSLTNQASMSITNKGNMSATHQGSMTATNKGNLSGSTEGSAMASVKGAITKLG